jgi:hypothetical protein
MKWKKLAQESTVAVGVKKQRLLGFSLRARLLQRYLPEEPVLKCE